MWETKIAGAQDCRILLKASQSCYTGILIELFMPKTVNETQILGQVNLWWFQCSHTALFPSYPALAKQTSGHNSYSIHFST